MASSRPFCVPGTTGRHSQRGLLQVRSAIKRTRDINVVCVKTIKAQKGKEAAMQKLCDRIQRYTEAQAKDKSKGIMAFNIHEDPYEKGLFHTWEHYKDVLHLGLHNSSDEFVGFMKQVNAVADGTPGMIMYEYRNGHLGAAAQQGGPKGEGGLDDTSGASKTATASSLRQNSKLGDMAHHQKPPKHEEEVWGMGFEVPWLKHIAKGVAGAVNGLTKAD